MSRDAVMEMARNNRQHEIEKIHGRQKDTTPEEAMKHNMEKFPHLFPSHDPYYASSKKNIGGKE